MMKTDPESKHEVQGHLMLAHAPVGIEKVHNIPSGLSAYEQDALKKLMPELSSSIQKGIDFAKAG